MLKYVFCGGMIRSGSTLQYNIVAELLESAFGSARTTWVEAADHAEFFRTNGRFPTAFKSHVLTAEIRSELEQGTSSAVATYRDVRDVVASSILKFGISPDAVSAVQQARVAIVNFSQWEAQEQTLVSKYEQFVDHVPEETARIADFLELRCSRQEIRRVAEKCTGLKALQPNLGSPARSDAFDSYTLLHSDHCNGGTVSRYREELGPDVISALNVEFGDWLASHGYSLDTCQRDDGEPVNVQGR